jgi:hypothetical protein
MAGTTPASRGGASCDLRDPDHTRGETDLRAGAGAACRSLARSGTCPDRQLRLQGRRTVRLPWFVERGFPGGWHPLLVARRGGAYRRREVSRFVLGSFDAADGSVPRRLGRRARHWGAHRTLRRSRLRQIAKLGYPNFENSKTTHMLGISFRLRRSRRAHIAMNRDPVLSQSSSALSAVGTCCAVAERPEEQVERAWAKPTEKRCCNRRSAFHDR